MKPPFTDTTSSVALALFSLYFLYGIFYISFPQFLVSLAVGGIVYGYTESYEFATLALFLTNFLFPLLGGGRLQAKEGFMATNPEEISKRIIQMKEGKYGVPEPVGVGSKMTEGFEDASGNDMTLSETKKETTNSSTATGESKPAPVPGAETPTPSPTPSPTQPPKALSEQGVPPVNQPATAGFRDNGALFKLGEIPTDVKGGPHIDMGSTIVNAMNALKPDQIKAMTDDTKQLIETQKSLMGLLQSITPMMQEGKQMMTTMQSMFGSTATA